MKSELIANNSFVGITGKYLTDIDVVDPFESEQSVTSDNCTLLRILKQNPQQHLYLNSPMIDGATGEPVKIIKIFQPKGKQFVRLDYEQFAQGIIIGI